MALQSAQIGHFCKTAHRGSHVSFEDASMFVYRVPQDRSLIGRSLRDSVAHRKYRDANEEVFLFADRSLRRQAYERRAMASAAPMVSIGKLQSQLPKQLVPA